MNTFFYRLFVTAFVISSLQFCVSAQLLSTKKTFSRQDSLRGGYGEGRRGWNVLKYDIAIKPDIDKKTISGINEISFYDSGFHYLQIDLQQPMQLDSAFYETEAVKFSREGNVYFVFPRDTAARYKIKPGIRKLRLIFSGKPREAKYPPWDGGWIWKQDSLGRPCVSVACQGLGASVWYPCKDAQFDESDSGASLTIIVPDSLTAVGNGRLSSKLNNKNGTTSWRWTVTNPINNYNIVPYIGKYVNFNDEFKGEKGRLDIGYWVLDYNLEKAKEHFAIVKPMLKCFEEWMGPYPFYENSYKLIDAPHLGMEHQSAVAYGNKYQNGYLGKDRSGSGWGSKFDFIIVHESGHEWFANSITSKDIADMWIHEGFTTYSETMFVQCQYGLQAANEYCIGQRKNIQNKAAIIGIYGVNEEGSTDMYDKASNMIHTIRQVINNDGLFKSMIRGLSKDFYHQTVTTKQVEQYMTDKSKKDLSKIFDQYLRSIKIPVLEYKQASNKLNYRWTNCVKGFNMPVKLKSGEWLYPTENFKTLNIPGNANKSFEVDPNFYITMQKLK